MQSIPRWPIWQVDKLIIAKLKDDTVIKSLQKITSGIARISGYRAVPSSKANFYPYIFFYSIPGVYTRINGNRIVAFNPDYDIENRIIGAPTADDVAVVERFDELIGEMKHELTPDGKWSISAVAKSEINITQQGEAPEVYYTRIGNSYKFAAVRA